jgi:NAD(P)-dependent dehydrogenase (short-subunit alcohol dehydrogenase family)
MDKTVNKIALVTGGSRGLGKDMVLSLAQKGIDIILTYQNRKDDAQAVVKAIEGLGQKAVALQLSVDEPNTYDRFFKEVTSALQHTFTSASFHFLINNAGTGTYGTFAQTTEAQFDSMVNTHLKATFFLTQKALSLLADGGAVVNLSSGLARFSMVGYAAYGPMKAAIDSLTRYQALELGARKIRVNSIAPGAIETDFGGGAVRDNAALNNAIASHTALGRVGLPNDIGSVVAFLCSDDAKWINGQRLEVSGGINL